MNPAAVLDTMIADPTINGQSVDVDGAFGGQCWDLAELFAERCGVPKEPWAIPLGPTGSAKEAWTCYSQSAHMQKYFDQIPAGQQQKGDITVYDGHGIYTEGHIAVSLGGNAVFEENADPDGSVAHVYNNRSSTYLLGALRLKGGSNMPGVPDTDVWYSRFRKLTQQIRGRDMSRDEFRKNIVPATDAFAAVQLLSDDPEADQNVQFAIAGRDVFNEGDRVNLNNYIYGHDNGAFKEVIGKAWKSAMYSIFEAEPFKTDQLVNSGDLAAINAVAATDAKAQVGKTWKDLFYSFLSGNIASDYVEVTEKLYKRKV